MRWLAYILALGLIHLAGCTKTPQANQRSSFNCESDPESCNGGIDPTAAGGSLDFTVPDTVTANTDFTISWGAVPGATSYDLLIGNDEKCADVAIALRDLITSSQKISMTNSGTFYACLEAKNAAGVVLARKQGYKFQVTNSVAGFSAANNLRIGADSATATTHSSTDDDTTIYFIWDAASDSVNGIKSYSLKYYEGTSCTGSESTVGAATNTSYTFSPAAYTKTYSFLIVATNNQDETKTSSCSSSITINYPVHTITFDTPANYTYDNTLLSVSGGVAALIAITQTYDDNSSTEFGLTKAHNNTVWDTDHLELKNAGAPDPRPLPNDFYYGVANSDLVFRLPFDDPIIENGNVLSEDFGHNSTLISGSGNKSVKGKNGRAFFAPDNDEVFTTNEANLRLTAYTLSGWIKSANLTSTCRLFEKGSTGSTRNYHLYVGGGQIYFRAATSVADDILINYTTSVEDDKWHYIVATAGSGSAALYVDGAKVGDDTYTGTIFTNTDGVASPVRCRNGAVDELAIWRRALSASEIATLYQNQVKNFTHEHWTEAPGLMDGNVLLLHMDEASGNLVDYSGLGNTVTANGDPAYVQTGQVSSSVTLDGTGDYFEVPDSDVFSPAENNMTISFWVNIPVGAPSGYIMSKSNNTNQVEWHIRFLSNYVYFSPYQLGGANYLTMGSVNQALNGSNSDDGVWHHVVYTLEPGIAARMYVDGVFRGEQTTFTGSMSNGTENLKIGRLIGSQDFTGSLDEVAIWNRALSPQEIQTIYSLQSGNYRGNVHELPNDQDQTVDAWFPMNGNVLLMHMNETSIKDSGTNPTVYDFSGNGNNGTFDANDDGAEKSVTGHLTSALTFDGTDDSIEVPGLESLIDSNQTGTILAWVKTPASTYEPFFSHSDVTAGNNYLAIGTESTQTVSFIFNSGGLSVLQTSDKISINSWNLIAITSDGSTYKIYVNGKLASLSTETNNDGRWFGDLAVADHSSFVGKRQISSSSDYSNGSIDELAIWNRALSEDEIKKIYDHQSAKYSGTFTSNVMDAGTTSASWTTLAWNMIRPYGKELGASSDLSSSYTALPNDTLMSGNVLLYHFNETAAGGATGGLDIEDYSGEGHHGDENGFAGYQRPGKFGYAMDFHGANEYITISNPSTLPAIDAAQTISFWFKRYDDSTNEDYYKATTSGGRDLHIAIDSGNIGAFKDVGVSLISTSTLPSIGEWHHLVYSYDTVNHNLSIDGTPLPSTTVAQDSGAPTSALISYTVGVDVINGAIDEFAIWNRALSATEMLELYKRGASRIRYKVRSCDASGCDDEPWIIPDNTLTPYSGTGEFFSELHNTTTSNPSLTFGGFGSHTVSNNQFFQWKAYLDTSDTSEIPELKSVTVGPTHYYGGNPTIVTSNALNFSSLISFTETSSVGTVKYQLSNDGGSTWYWYNSGWSTTTSEYAESSSATDINTNIATFPVGSGSLQVKAFLNSAAATQATSLENVSVQYTP